MKTIQNNNAFTLVEFLVYLVLSGIVATSIINLFITNSQVHQHQENITTTFQEVRTALSIIAGDIRSAGCDPLKSNTMGFVNDSNDHLDCDSNSIHFTRDITGESDGQAISPDEDICYYLDSDSIIRSDNGDLLVIGDNITNLSFSYFNSDGDDITGEVSSGTYTNIRTVEINITAQSGDADFFTKKANTMSLHTRVKVRNMGL